MTSDVNQTAGVIVNIENAENLHLQQFFVDPGDYIPLGHFLFDYSRYNLFVIDSSVKQNGSFTIQFDNMLEHTEHTHPIDKLMLDKICYYPSVIASVNDSFAFSEDYRTAVIGKVHTFEITGNGVKFWYNASVKFKQQTMNENPDFFMLRHSDQSNELDSPHWEIKEMNLLSRLQLKKE